MITAVIGSRGFTNYDALARVLDKCGITRVVSGGAKGADRLAELWSTTNGLPPPIIFLPDWKKNGRAAGVIRNRDIVNASTHVVVFWDGTSKGTLSSIEYANKQGIKCTVWIYDSTTQELTHLR